MKKKSAVLILVLVLCSVFLLAACGNSASNPLIGKWKDEATGLSTIEFKDDGSMIIYLMDQNMGSGTYKVDGNKITMTVEGQEQSGTFKVEGNKLTLENGSSGSQVFVKQ